MGIPTAGSNLLSLQPGAGHRAGVQVAGAVWPALCPRDRLPCGLCTKPHLPAPAQRWGAAPANWSAGRGQRRPAGAGGEGGGLCSHHRPSGWGAREEGWRRPGSLRSSAGEAGWAELSTQRGDPQKEVWPLLQLLPAQAEGPPGEGGCTPTPRRQPPACPDHIPRRQQPQTQAPNPAKGPDRTAGL